MQTHWKLFLFFVVLFLLLLILIPFSCSYKSKRVIEKEVGTQETSVNTPVFKGGYYRYGIKRMKITATPQKYSFDKGGDWEFWYDNPRTGEAFYVQFSPDGEKIDSRETRYINHPPWGEVWLSKKPGTKDQWITLSYSFPRKNKN